MKANKMPGRKELADFKRLTELCMADPGRREAFFSDPGGTLKQWKLDTDTEISLEAIQILCGKADVPARQNPYLAALQHVIDRIHRTFAKEMTPEKITNSKLRGWYLRKTAGYGFQSSICRHKEGLFYIPAVFELSDGCSVGCSFCCLAAEQLKQNFTYTEENKKMWREILRISREVIGEAVRMSVCYFATEPFDNPGYEQFLADFHQMFGRYPQTTTAVLQRDAQRTKDFLTTLGEEPLKLAALRGSIISLKQLDQIHENFSSEELNYVELLFNNPESSYGYSRAGRSIQLSEELTDKKFVEDASSICVCGFVINLVKKTVMLASPHIPDEAHPLGMEVYEEIQFEDAGQYRQVLQELIEKWMSAGIPKDKPLQMPAALTWERKGFRVKVRGDGISRSISLSDVQYQCFLSLVEEHRPLQEIYEEKQLKDFQRQQMTERLQILYQGGCLEERKEQKERR